VSTAEPLAVELPPPCARNAAPDDEPALAERVRTGDAAAFETLANRYMRRAFAVAYRLMGQKEDAEDLVQEAFMAVLQRIGTFEPGRPFAPWFFRILVNRGLNARKARSLRAVDQIPDGTAARGPTPEREAERSELRQRLRLAMDSLPERQRVIVELFELEGFGGPEIAEILEISDGTVRWHLHEARKTLKKALAPYERST
jgi:RNA polymerase sigma-70 factor, ECF subfamily